LLSILFFKTSLWFFFNENNNDFNLVPFLLIFYCFPWTFCQSFYNFQFYPSNQVQGFYFFNDDDDDDINNNNDDDIINDRNDKDDDNNN
jgi:hypothetical protein